MTLKENHATTNKLEKLPYSVQVELANDEYKYLQLSLSS